MFSALLKVFVALPWYAKVICVMTITMIVLFVSSFIYTSCQQSRIEFLESELDKAILEGRIKDVEKIELQIEELKRQDRGS